MFSNKSAMIQNEDLNLRFSQMLIFFSLFPYRFMFIMSTVRENALSLADGFNRKEYNLNLLPYKKCSRVFTGRLHWTNFDQLSDVEN